VIGSLAAVAGALALRPRSSMAQAAPVLTRTIPASGEQIPVIGLGTWQEFDIGTDPSRRAEASATFRDFFDAGLRVVDTSPMYGAAEAVVGELLEKTDSAKRAFVATKVWATGAEAGRRQIDNSFRLLRRDRIDLFQVHNLVDCDVQLAALEQLKQAGRVRYIGVTHYTRSAHADLVRYIERGTIDFVQVNYSLVERDAGDSVLPAAAAHRVAVLVNRPFAKGGFFAQVRGRPLPALAARVGATSWAQFALKWIVSNPAVTCVIPGTRNPSHLLDNARAGSGDMPDAATRARMLAAFTQA
jgi:aryl-alcohol dehydrogenase-like predicted oxidoreductase